MIRSATLVAADLLNMSGEIGRLLPGAQADLLLLDGDPFADLTVLAEPADHLLAVVPDGSWCSTGGDRAIVVMTAG